MRRYLETLFRRKDIFLIPLIVTPLVALGFLAIRGGQFEVTAAIWVEPSPFLSETGAGSGDDETPNEVEAQALNEWLLTGSFRDEVMERSGLAQRVNEGSWPRLNGAQQVSRSLGLDSVPLLGGLLRMVGLAGPSNQGEARMLAHQTVRDAVEVTPEGSNLVLISHTGNDPGLGPALITAVIDVYRERKIERRTAAVEEALAFQQGQVDEQQARVQEAGDALSGFLGANPAPRAPAAEAEAERLRRNQELAQTVYEDALLRLNELRVQGEAAVSTGGQSFQVVDPAGAPESGGVGGRMMLMMLFLGLVLGGALGAAGIAVVSWTDGTVRGAEDVNGMVDAPVSGQVPAPATASNGQRGAQHVARLIAQGRGR